MLSQGELATALEGLTPTVDADAGADALASAYATYMGKAVAGGTPIIRSAISATAAPAMTAAMNFASDATAADGADVVVAGVQAFWDAMVAAPASFFSGATAITPPPFASLASSLAATFSGNLGSSLEQAASTLAADLHGATDDQGTATIAGSPVLIT